MVLVHSDLGHHWAVGDKCDAISLGEGSKVETGKGESIRVCLHSKSV